MAQDVSKEGTSTISNELVPLLTRLLVSRFNFFCVAKTRLSEKTLDRAPAYIIWLGGAIGLTYGSIMNAQHQMEADDYSHRP
jgi:hypothetical protein